MQSIEHIPHLQWVHRLYLLLLLSLYVVSLSLHAQPSKQGKKTSTQKISAKKTSTKTSSLQTKSFESQVVIQQLDKNRWHVDTQAEGKKIRTIHFVRLPVFMAGEALSSLTLWLNHLHATSRKSMIAKELKVYENQTWQHADALESERNLRRLGVFSLVRVLAIHIPPTPSNTASSSQNQCDHPKGCVDVVVVSRDLWSLRLESAFEYNAGVLNQLKLSLTERNFLGQRIILKVPMFLTPFQHKWGVEFSHRRWGPDLSLAMAVSGTWNRDTQEQEGNSIAIQLAHPIYHLDQNWSWKIGAQNSSFFNRLAQGNQVIQQVINADQNNEQAFAIQWGSRLQALQASVGRQWPGTYQHTLDLGGYWQSLVHQIDPLVPQFVQKEWRSTYMPPQQTEAGPTLQYSVFRRSYVALYDVSSFGVREDLQVGTQLTVQQNFSLLNQLAYIPTLQMSWKSLWQRQGFIALAFHAAIRKQFEADADQVALNPNYGQTINQAQSWINRSLSFSYILVSPPIARHYGRFVHRVSMLNQWYNVQNQAITLGGSNGLRGYATDQFYLYGGDRIQNNIEYRSAPLLWSSVHLGGVVFYDAGSVHDRINNIAWKQSIGMGARLLFPQLNRGVFRVDLAMPMNQDGWQVLVSASSGQAFSIMPWESL